MEQYRDFGIEDFVWDNFFRQWVLAPTRESDSAWNQWLLENPKSSTLVQQAKEIVLALRVQETDLSTREIDQLVKRTISRINQPAPVREFEIEQPLHFYKRIWFQLAASVVLAMIAGWWLAVNRLSELHMVSKVETLLAPEGRHGLIEKINKTEKPLLIKLEDGSLVTLTTGSSIRYPEKFAEHKREVFLVGEAFFDISKAPERPFLVYANELVTKVLGTSFTIKAYASSREVTVEVKTGRVSVFAKSDPDLDAKISKRELEGVILTPNQKIIFERDEIRMVKTLVEKPEIITAVSQTPHFEFEDTPASDVFASIGKAYGIDILYDEELLKGCPLTATLDNQTLHEKLDIICKAVEASYEILDGQIIVHSRGCRN